MPDTLAASADVYHRALDARDVRFDGVFFVGITTTKIYCRPVCPARISDQRRRRFFASAAAAERDGFRPCLRCRPELAPGRAVVDAVSRLARAAEQRIAAGALNGHSVPDLAAEFGVSERHLRRVIEREIGATPVELALTHRLLLAKRLLADTTLSVTRIAYASGFQSLRRFNSAFRERYRMAPSAMRRAKSARAEEAADEAPLHLTLAYRPPLAWDALLGSLRRGALTGVEVVVGSHYCRTIRIGQCAGVVVATHDAVRHSVAVDVSSSLVPVLMPLLVRLRHLFDLDADTSAIEAHLGQCGVDVGVPGMRVPGECEGFDAVLRASLGVEQPEVVAALGDVVQCRMPGLTRLAPAATQVATAGAETLVPLGVPRARADSLATIARLVSTGELRLEPGADPDATFRRLCSIPGFGTEAAAAVSRRALAWPDAFDSSDATMPAIADCWQPWRAYGAMHVLAGRR